jgi:2-methylaconitate cis-trans-isomerase PrpF
MVILSRMTDTRGQRIAVTLMRGGTSKGVFVREADLPPLGVERDQLLLALMGSPDPMQLDGLGGTHTSTSKVISLAPSSRPGIDVEYRFAQVGIETPVVDHTGNCGNLTAAVGPYAIDAGWVTPVEPVTTVHLYNLNSDTTIRALVPVVDGLAAGAGDQLIAGVPSPGPRIVTEYLNPAGHAFGRQWPSGQTQDELIVDGAEISVTVLDVVHPVAFASAAALGIEHDVSPAELNASPEMVERAESLRRACASMLPAPTESLNLPRLVLLRPPRAGDDVHIDVLGTSAGRFHHALPATSTLCAAAAVVLPATVPHRLAAQSVGSDVVRIRHPKGVVEATVGLDPAGEVSAVGLVRTARRLMDGTAYVVLTGLSPTLVPSTVEVTDVD